MVEVIRQGYYHRRGTKERTTPNRVQRTTLEAECLRLRAKGYTLEEVADMVGVRTAGQVDYMIKAALERKGKPDADSIRSDLTDRLDRAYNLALRYASQSGPDRVAALSAATQIAARIAALHGADAPKGLDIKDDRTLPPDAATRSSFLEELARKADEEEQGGG